jgi:hypothetical protein
MGEKRLEGSSVIIKNRAIWAITTMQLALILSFPAVIWFGLVILEFPVSVVGFTITWIGLLVVLQYFPSIILAIEFQDDRLTAMYRRGVKSLLCQDIVRVVWRKGFASGGLGVTLKNGDLVRMGALESKLVDMILAAIEKYGPNLKPITTRPFPMGGSMGIIADENHRDERVAITWSESFGYDYFYWGRSPKSRVDSGSDSTHAGTESERPHGNAASKGGKVH